ncbi:MFS transporter [Rheinheimera sp.]|uniref:MFS transporter n=1 Tax=Rheinheimera sp. TaxID=1869214 RepID=UPI002733720B|nr:MFS transporter [Rheinheimera sp.]MDP2713774.1 MFS transporter [Rheinheimera sp.]
MMLQHLDLTKPPANHPLIYFLLAFIAMAGLSYINFLPGVVNALAGGIGFTEVEAGQIVALNGYGALLGSAIAIFLVRRLQWQPVMLAFLALLTLIDVSTLWIQSYSVMLGWRFFAGVAGGLSVGMAFSVLARLDNPDRAFGTLLLLQFSIGSLVIYLLPALEQLSNAYAVFYVMAAIAASSLVFMLCLPALALSRGSTARLTALAAEPGGRAYRKALLLLLAIMVYQIAASAIWAYVGLIGLAANIATDSVNTYIALTGLTGLAGAMLPVVTGRRFGRLHFLLALSALSVIAALLLNYSQHSLLYVVAMALLFFCWPAVLSYLLAVSAQTDSSGRLSAIAALVSSVGLATGPLFAAGLLDNGNFSLMLYACALLFLFSCLLLVKPVLAQERPQPALRPSQPPLQAGANDLRCPK